MSMTSEPPDRPVVLQVLHRMGIGGAEVLVDRMVRNMSDRYSFVIACLDEVGTLGEGLISQGVQVVNLRRGAGLDRACIKGLRAVVNDANVALIHAHQYTPFFYSIAARGLFGRVPLVFTEHGRHFPDTKRWKRVVFNRLMARKSDRIVGVGDAVKNALIVNEGFADSQVKVIYNGIPIAHVTETRADRAVVRRELGIPQDAQVIVQVARLDYLKDHKTAALAFSQLADRIPNVYWLVVGDGPKRAEITNQIKALNCNNRILLVGERNDVPRLLHASDIMLLSSISEGIPLTLIEGMLAELPIVSTEVGGVGEVVIAGQHGFLVESGNAKAMGERLEQLVGSRHLQREMGTAARIRARSTFDEDSMHSEYDAVYQDSLLVSAQ